MAVNIATLPNAENFIEEFKLWDMVWVVSSWHLQYPVYAMDLSELKKYDPEWVRTVLEVEEMINNGNSVRDMISKRINAD